MLAMFRHYIHTVFKIKNIVKAAAYFVVVIL